MRGQRGTIRRFFSRIDKQHMTDAKTTTGRLKKCAVAVDSSRRTRVGTDARFNLMDFYKSGLPPGDYE